MISERVPPDGRLASADGVPGAAALGRRRRLCRRPPLLLAPTVRCGCGNDLKAVLIAALISGRWTGSDGKPGH